MADLRSKYEVAFFPRVKKTLDSKVDETIAVLESSGTEAAISSLNNDLVNPELAKEVRRIYTIVGVRFANIEHRSLKQAERTKAAARFSYDEVWIRWILDYLRKHLLENVLYKVNKTTKEHLLNVIGDGLRKGLSVEEIVNKLKSDKFTETQAARVVRTEVGMADNAGVLAAGNTYEYETQKKWIARKDNRTRGSNPKDHASHIELNGTVIDLEDFFVDSRNGDQLMSPGDPNASAVSIINCRCRMALVAKRDSRGRLIPKKNKIPVRRRKKFQTIEYETE